MPYNLPTAEGSVKQVYLIRSLDSFLARFEALQRQADKLGLIAPKFQLLKTEVMPAADPELLATTRELQYHITVAGPEVRLPGGWSLLGQLDHLGTVNLLFPAEGKSI